MVYREVVCMRCIVCLYTVSFVGLISTWMGDRLGTPHAGGILPPTSILYLIFGVLSM